MNALDIRVFNLVKSVPGISQGEISVVLRKPEAEIKSSLKSLHAQLQVEPHDPTFISRSRSRIWFEFGLAHGEFSHRMVEAADCEPVNRNGPFSVFNLATGGQ